MPTIKTTIEVPVEIEYGYDPPCPGYPGSIYINDILIYGQRVDYKTQKLIEQANEHSFYVLMEDEVNANL